MLDTLQSFVGFRLCHTLAMVPLRAQPWRFYACAAAAVANLFMAFRVFRALM